MIRGLGLVLAGALAACGAAQREPPAPAVELERGAVTPDPAPVCAALDPAPANPVLGSIPRPAPSLAGPSIDGGRIDLAELRGRVVLVAFEASWDITTRSEQPTLAPLAAALGDDLAIVRVASEDTIEVARAAVPARAPYRTIFDAARGACSPLGALTASWGVNRVAETFLIDRGGNIRFHFQRARDWSSPEAIACVRALAADRAPAITRAPEITEPPRPCPEAAPDAGEHVIRGAITIPPQLRGRAKLGTAIFIVARRADAQHRATGLPIVVDRVTYQSDTVPFVLDRSKQLPSDAVLAGELVVTARYDQDGDAMTRQPGDLVGEVVVTPPAIDVALVLDRAIP